MNIEDGTGTSREAGVDKTHRVEVHSVSVLEGIEAVVKGDAYNLNTGTIQLTNNVAQGVFYLKNNEDRDFIVDLIAAGIGSAGTTTDVSTLTIIRNPTSVSFSTNVDMNQNRNFGSSKTLVADVFKGAQSATVTGGNAIAQFFIPAGSRLAAPIGLSLSKGDSLAMTIDTNTTAGATNVYTAIVGHLKREDR